jgi:hypothetical protein
MLRTRNPWAAGVLLAAAALAGAGLGAGTAQAGNLHTVVTANSPSTGEPIAGGGSWIVNKPSGYYLGRELPGGQFDNEQNSAANWHYGRASTTINMCGWAMPGSLGTSLGAVSDSCSDATKATLSHRRSIGRDYNAAAHAATDGSAVPANPGCTLHYNYFHGTDFAGGANGGHWADPAGNPGSSVQYRFTTLDGQAAVVRDHTLGWGFLPVGCVTRPAALFNDDD